VNRSVKIHGVKWGTEKQGGTRVRLSDAGWREPLKWNRDAEANEQWHAAYSSGDAPRPRVFCASLADVFEDWDGPIVDHLGSVLWRHPEDDRYLTAQMNEEWRLATMDDLRADLFRLIDATPNLEWMLLTKRPENIWRMWIAPDTDPMTAIVPSGMSVLCGRPNVWLGTSCSDQATADKAIPELLKCRGLARVLFVSAEPLIGPIDFDSMWPGGMCAGNGPYVPGIDLIITGGESGPNARPCRPEWIRFVGQQCQAAGVKWFNKQLGSNIVTRNDMVEDQFNSRATGWPDPDVEYDIHGFREDYQGADCRIRLRDPKGGNMDEWPEDLRVREMPT